MEEQVVVAELGFRSYRRDFSPPAIEEVRSEDVTDGGWRHTSAVR
jgi:hypothetical protein